MKLSTYDSLISWFQGSALEPTELEALPADPESVCSRLSSRCEAEPREQCVAWRSQGTRIKYGGDEWEVSKNPFEANWVRIVLFAFLIGVPYAQRANAEEDAKNVEATSTVGVAKRIEQLVLPGSKLQVKPLENRHQPFVLRLIEVYPHGTDNRYDFEFYALESGQYDLTQYLIRADASSVENLPKVLVQVNSTLPEGQIRPSSLLTPQLPSLGGYRLTWFVGVLVWLGGLYALLNIGRKKIVSDLAVVEKPVSLADRLRPLVQSARDGTLATEQRSALERMLLSYWCQRLNLMDTSPGLLMVKLREHAEAGPLVRSLENWLHCPNPSQPVDLEKLLEPYANVSEKELHGSQADSDRSVSGHASNSIASRTGVASA